MKIDCISDLHGFLPELPGGDLLIVAGDLTARDDYQEWKVFFDWIRPLNYRRKVVVCGNHDRFMEYNPGYMVDDCSFDYLCDSGTEFEGLKIWGSPWTLRFEGENPAAMAFTCETEEELAEKWALIPNDVDILVTHSPPFSVLDTTKNNEQVGSASLMGEHLARLRPRLWVMGHIHEAYGQDGPYTWNKTKYVNASHVNERYEPVNKPVRVEL